MKMPKKLINCPPAYTDRPFYQFAWEETKIDPVGSYFSTTDLALFEADSRREAAKLLRDFRTNLESEIQKLADPARKGSVMQVHLFLQELQKEDLELLGSMMAVAR